MALINSKKTIIKIWNEWEKQFGRAYHPVETYKTKGAETMILTMGSMGENGLGGRRCSAKKRGKRLGW